MRPVTSAPLARLETQARTALGLFTAADARAAGLAVPLLRYHSRPGGRWRRTLPRVYELVDHPADARRPMLAALLWGGDAAVLSHRAAAWVLGLDGIRTAKPELWLQRRGAPPDVIVHQGSVPVGEVTTTRLLRHTTALRTVVDLAAVLDDETLELVVESALRTHAGERELRTAAGCRRRGSRRLERVLARRPPGAPPTGSELETRFLQIVRRVDLPAPVRQYPVYLDGRCIAQLDVAWPEAGLWVELDSRQWHDRPQALFYDRHRQNDLIARLHWLPLRYTWDDVVNHPMSTARSTASVYRRRLAASGTLIRPPVEARQGRSQPRC